MAEVYACAVCRRADVRRYRLYGNFLRENDIFCNAHIPGPASQRDWWVPMIQDEDGTVWGYLAIPAPAMRGWAALSDSIPDLVWADGAWHDARPAPDVLSR